MESRQKKDGQGVASKGHRRDKIENINKKHTDSRNKLVHDLNPYLAWDGVEGDP